jgi:hypothetical protein
MASNKRIREIGDADDLLAALYALDDAEQTRFTLQLLANFDRGDVLYLKEAAETLSKSGVNPDDKAGFYRVLAVSDSDGEKKEGSTPVEDFFNFELLDPPTTANA